MRLSVSLLSRHAYEDPRRGVEVMVERTVAARDAGLDALYLGDHHSVPSGYYQNTPMLGRLLADWPRTAGSLYLLPLWHPVILAEQVATLAAIARGRFILQVALGGGAAQFAALGLKLRDRVMRFEAGLDIVRRLLAGEEVSAGEPFPIDLARVSPLPDSPVEVWLAGHSPQALDRAARMADGWVGGPEASIEQTLVLANGYRVACAAHKRDPGPVVARVDVHVAGDRAEADRVRTRAIETGYRGFDPEVLVIGVVGDVVAELRLLADGGVDEVEVRHIAEDQDDVLASMARLADVRGALVKA
jgi:alkanesulfonate monooxygenase SsuD/methylene tetrahydromethanopterin reductase-like flavin-dependent oxidoreductase (luciferase family)